MKRGMMLRGKKTPVGLLALGLATALALTGCSGDDVGEPEGIVEVTELPESTTPPIDGIVGELATVDGHISVGDEITVLVDLPSQGWEITNSDDSVAEVIAEDTEAGASIVHITGLSVGEALIVFEVENGETDELAVTVSK